MSREWTPFQAGEPRKGALAGQLWGGSSRGRTRTCDPLINSQLLYQLSYSGRRDRILRKGGNFKRPISLRYNDIIATPIQHHNDIWRLSARSRVAWRRPGPHRPVDGITEDDVEVTVRALRVRAHSGRYVSGRSHDAPIQQQPILMPFRREMVHDNSMWKMILQGWALSRTAPPLAFPHGATSARWTRIGV